MTIVELYVDHGVPENVCPTCDKQFEDRDRRERHHGRSHAANIGYAIVRCDACGNVFRRMRGQAKRNDIHYCDKQCLGDGRRGEDNPAWSPRLDVECGVCGEELQRTWWQVENTEVSFCSDECNAEWLSENMSGEDHENVWKGGHVNYYGPNWREQREKALERDGYRCQVCSVDESDYHLPLDVHHIKRVKKFKDEYEYPEWYKKANKLDNLISLCRSCHKRWEGIPLTPEVDHA